VLLRFKRRILEIGFREDSDHGNMRVDLDVFACLVLYILVKIEAQNAGPKGSENCEVLLKLRGSWDPPIDTLVASN
jgi:hypothetical protein